MAKANDLGCYHAVSRRLGKLLVKANEDTLRAIATLVLSDLKKHSILDANQALLQDCLQFPSTITEDRFWNVKEALYKLKESAQGLSSLDFEDVVVDVCWAFGTGESLLHKVDEMLYQLGGLENHERDRILNLALNGTLGWHSRERGK